MEGHGDDGPFRKVLNSDAKGQGKGSGGGDGSFAAHQSRQNYTHGHAFGKIVQGDGEDHHGGALQGALRAFTLFAVHMEMGDDTVQHHQEKKADPKTDHGGKEG